MVEGESLLQTIAEISVAFAGFTGVVGAFGRSSGSAWSAGDRLRFNVMLGNSLAALLFALLPLIVYHLGSRDEAVWRISSLAFAIYLAGTAFFDIRLFRSGRARPDASDRPSPTIAVLVGTLTFSAMIVQVLNALSIGFHREVGAYLLGLAILLAVSSLMFIRLLSFASASR